MNATEAVIRAAEEPTLAKALSWICVWECERAIRQAEKNPQWETCFEYCIKAVMEAWQARSTIAAPAQIEWTDEHNCKHTVPVQGAATLLKEYFDEWPGGLEEIESIINQWRKRSETAEAKLAAPASTAAPVCPHRLADARNQVITNGYLCLDCGAVFAAADHGAAPVVPEGWKLVPIEPTPEMLDAYCHGLGPSVNYRDMLAAAPKPDA